MADPVQARAREGRLATALRANLKRRKAQVAQPTATDQHTAPTDPPPTDPVPTEVPQCDSPAPTQSASPERPKT